MSVSDIAQNALEFLMFGVTLILILIFLNSLGRSAAYLASARSKSPRLWYVLGLLLPGLAHLALLAFKRRIPIAGQHQSSATNTTGLSLRRVELPGEGSALSRGFIKVVYFALAGFFIASFVWAISAFFVTVEVRYVGNTRLLDNFNSLSDLFSAVLASFVVLVAATVVVWFPNWAIQQLKPIEGLGVSLFRIKRRLSARKASGLKYTAISGVKFDRLRILSAAAIAALMLGLGLVYVGLFDLEREPDNAAYAFFDINVILLVILFFMIFFQQASWSLMRSIHSKNYLAIDVARKVSDILYLRSFHLDKKRLFENGTLPFARESTELSVMKVLSEFGQPVAIGIPNEKIPPMGIPRVYADDFTWQSLVTDLIAASSWIVLQIGSSNWVEWELRRIVESNQLERTIIVFPAKVDNSLVAGWKAIVSGLNAPDLRDALTAIDPRNTIAVMASRPDLITTVHSKSRDTSAYRNCVWLCLYVSSLDS